MQKKRMNNKAKAGLILYGVILILLLSGVSRAETTLVWENPINIEFDSQNKNLWKCQETINFETDSFSALAIYIDSKITPPSEVAIISINGLFDREIVNITGNLTNSDTWNIFYLSESIEINQSAEYTLRIFIHANNPPIPDVEDGLTAGTRAVPGGDSIPEIYNLFRVGEVDAINDAGVEALPTLSTGEV